ncbi:UPF0175 family protein [uncultured Methylobacterium sp.]|uniref:UPF0175 family protein n=1 Tax=uncultured Methylobacterium sp. TaxID=157278 RepID=UPI0035CBB220
MNITLPIPDELARKLQTAGGSDLSRRALEAFGAEEYRAGRLTLPELRRMLGFDTRYALDGFLKARGVYLDYGVDDLEQERRDLAQLGFR